MPLIAGPIFSGVPPFMELGRPVGNLLPSRGFPIFAETSWDDSFSRGETSDTVRLRGIVPVRFQLLI